MQFNLIKFNSVTYIVICDGLTKYTSNLYFLMSTVSMMFIVAGGPGWPPTKNNTNAGLCLTPGYA